MLSSVQTYSCHLFVVSHYVMFVLVTHIHLLFFFFFFNDTAPTEIYTLSLHDALPIFLRGCVLATPRDIAQQMQGPAAHTSGDRKSTRLNSSHLGISYAVFCLKKKKKKLNKKHKI